MKKCRLSKTYVQICLHDDWARVKGQIATPPPIKKKKNNNNNATPPSFQRRTLPQVANQ